MPGKKSNGVSVGAVGGRNKKVLKRRPRRGLRSYAKAVAKYLASDTYMYAPLLEEEAPRGCGTSFPSCVGDAGHSPMHTETLRKLGAKVSAKRVLYEEFVK